MKDEREGGERKNVGAKRSHQIVPERYCRYVIVAHDHLVNDDLMI